MPRTYAKLPMPFFLSRDIEAGLTLTQIADKYGVLKTDTVVAYIRKHNLPMPAKARAGLKKGAVRRAIIKAKADEPEQLERNRTWPTPDERKIVVERYSEFYKPSGQPVPIRISLPRLKFLHGHWDGKDDPWPVDGRQTIR